MDITCDDSCNALMIDCLHKFTDDDNDNDDDVHIYQSTEQKLNQ